MSINPFVNCKSRKRRKVNRDTPTTKKPYCPRSMVRYDRTTTGFPTIWTCKMCLTCILCETALSDHIEKCKLNMLAQTVVVKIEPGTVKPPDDPKYICEICNRMFSRRVTLKQHSLQHIDNSSDYDSDDE